MEGAGPPPTTGEGEGGSPAATSPAFLNVAILCSCRRRGGGRADARCCFFRSVVVLRGGRGVHGAQLFQDFFSFNAMMHHVSACAWGRGWLVMGAVTCFNLLAWVYNCLQGGPAGGGGGVQGVALPASYTVAFVCVCLRVLGGGGHGAQ